MRLGSIKVFVAVIVLLAGGALHAATPAERGAAIYKTKCTQCHGADGRAQTAMGKSLHAKDLASSVVQSQSDADLQNVINYGQGRMPAFTGRLTDDQINDVVAHIRTFKPHKKKK